MKHATICIYAQRHLNQDRMQTVYKTGRQPYARAIIKRYERN